MKLEFTKMALTTREALNYVIKGICGNSAVSRIAEAEGLALTGKRTGCLLQAEPAQVPSSLKSVPRSFVYPQEGEGDIQLMKASEAVFAGMLAFLESQVQKRPMAIAVDKAILDKVAMVDAPTESSMQDFSLFLENKDLPSTGNCGQWLSKAGFSLSRLSEDPDSQTENRSAFVGEIGNSEFTRNCLRLFAEEFCKIKGASVFLTSHPKRSLVFTLSGSMPNMRKPEESGKVPILISTNPVQLRNTEALSLLADKGILLLNQVFDSKHKNQSLFFQSEIEFLEKRQIRVKLIETTQWDDIKTCVASIVDTLRDGTTSQVPDLLPIGSLVGLRQKSIPVMPEEETTHLNDDLTWKFHLLGRKAAGQHAGAFDHHIQPLALEPLLNLDNELSHYPLVVLENGEVKPFKLFAKEILKESGGSIEILSSHLDFFIFNILEALRVEDQPMDLLSGLKAGLKTFLKGLQVSQAGRDALNKEIDLFFGKLPNGKLLGLNAGTSLILYMNALNKKRGESIQSFVAEAKRLRQKLNDILSIQENKEREKNQGQHSSMGTVSGSLFKQGSGSPRKHSGTVAMDATRKARIESVLHTLDAFIQQAQSGPQVHLIHRETLPLTPSSNLKIYQHHAPLDVAHGIFKSIVEDMTQLFINVRIARLELADSYNESVHGTLSKQFNISTFTEEDWAVFPVIAVIESVDHIKNHGMNEFSSLLGSTFPIHILLTETPWKKLLSPLQDNLVIHRDLGYLAMSHKDAFVLRSCLSDPMQLNQGFQKMAVKQTPCVAIIAASSPSEAPYSWETLHAFLAGRASNLYQYDPSVGSHWAERFEFMAASSGKSIWPSFEARYLDSNGVENSLEVSFTFADATCLLQKLRDHFMVIQPSEWSESQVYLPDYLTNPDILYSKFVPYIWVIDQNRMIHRAVISRDLTLRCEDRMGLWSTLAELGGIENSHAILVGEQIRKEAEANFHAEVEALKSRYQQEIETVRTDTARDALGQLARVLIEMEPGQDFNLKSSAPEHTAGAAPIETPEAPVEVESAAANPVAESEVLNVVEEAYVETELCTSCNECVTMNPLLFKYNANKQVELGSLEAGTFLQLVSAAEKCPSRCIHPGSPRAGDSTVTDELVAKAVKFN